MEKLSFSISSRKPKSKAETVHNTFDSDSDSDSTTQNNNTTHVITEFDPSKPLTTKFTIPPLQNQWKPSQHTASSATAPCRRTQTDTELLRKLKLKNDLQTLPEDRGFDEFNDVSVASFGAGVLAGYGWTKGMGIGKNAKDDVKVVQFKHRYAGEGLGFVRHNAKLDHCNQP